MKVSIEDLYEMLDKHMTIQDMVDFVEEKTGLTIELEEQ